MRFYKWLCISLFCAGVSANEQKDDPFEQAAALAKDKNISALMQYANAQKAQEAAQLKRIQAKAGASAAALNRQAKALVNSQRQGLERQLRMMEQNGDMALYSQENVAKQARKYHNEAQLIVDEGQAKLQQAMVQHVGLDEQTAAQFTAPNVTTQDAHYVSAFFISFSMSEADIQEILQVAARTNARVYLNGLHKDHRSINQTMALMRQIATGLEKHPVVMFNPKLFKRFDVIAVPTILHMEDDKTVWATGIANMDWLRTKHKHSEDEGYLGNYGTVYEVDEISIVEEMKRRAAAIDWDAKRKAAVERFWKHQDMVKLPAASKDETWFIDPTFRVSQDISNSQGVRLAKAGTVSNALAGDGAVPLTAYLFDATDNRQLQWLHKRLQQDHNIGNVMILFSELNRDKGWEHLDALRAHFGRELYKIPAAMVSKFKITALPVKMTTDMQNKVLKFEQYSIQEH